MVIITSIIVRSLSVGGLSIFLALASGCQREGPVPKAKRPGEIRPPQSIAPSWRFTQNVLRLEPTDDLAKGPALEGYEQEKDTPPEVRSSIVWGIDRAEKGPCTPHFLLLLLSSGGSNRREMASFDDDARGKAIAATWILREGPPVSFLWNLGAKGQVNQLKLEGKDHELAAGRIFVLDRQAQPAKLLQIDAPIPPTFTLDPADTKANRAVLKKLIARLRDEHAEIAEFAKAGFQYQLTGVD